MTSGKPYLVESLARSRVWKLPNGRHKWFAVFIERDGMDGVCDAGWDGGIDKGVVEGFGIEAVEYPKARETEGA